VTVAEYAAQWLEAVRLQRRLGTYRNYEYCLRCHVLPTLGARELGTVRRSDVRSLVTMLLRDTGLKASTTKTVIIALRSLFSAAVEDELIPYNVASAPKKLIQQRSDEGGGRPALMGDDLVRFLRAAELLTPAFFPVFLLMARTGVRIGEALGLQWDDLDFTRRRARIVRQAWPKGRIGPTKTGRPHEVDLSAQLVTVLQQHRASIVGPWCFPGAMGWPYSRSTLHLAFRQIAAGLGLDAHCSPHSLRHGFASTLLAKGVPLAYVQRALNHTDPKLTSSLYGSHAPNENVAAVDSLDDLVGLMGSLSETDAPHHSNFRMKGFCIDSRIGFRRSWPLRRRKE